MEKRKFEESWKDAFAQAEISPPENVWTNVELDLEKAKGDRLKKVLFFYQLLAAACVLFAIGVGIAVYVVGNSASTVQHLAAQQPSVNPSQQNATGTALNKTTPQQNEQLSETSADNQANKNSVGSVESERLADNVESERPVNNVESENTVGNDQKSNDDDSRPADQTPQATIADLSTSIAKELKSKDGNARSTHQALQSSAVDVTASETQSIADKTLQLSDRSSKNGTVTRKGEVNQTINKEKVNTLSDNSTQPSIETVLIAPEKKDVEGIFSPSLNRPLPALVENQKKIALHVSGSGIQEVAADPVALMLAKLERRENEISQIKDPAEEKEEEKTRTGENLWTSIGFAAGSFNSVNSKAPSVAGFSSNNALALGSANTFASVADKETKASGITYSMGVNVGTKLSNRWVLQGGLNYLSQSSEYTQDNLLSNGDFSAFQALTINDIKEIESQDADADHLNSSTGRKAIVNTPPHNVNNNVRYLSIPLQAGYLVVNRDFGVQLNAGVSTDLFLQNTITATADGEKVDPSKSGIGEDSAFRPVNLSGLMGTEVSYKFGKHYRVALNPGLRYPFSSIYKSDDYKATRITFDVGLRFRYIFH